MSAREMPRFILGAKVPIPAWIFEHPGQYFMVGIEPDGRVRVDGGHRNPQSVAKAKRLHESIADIAAPAGTKFLMIKVDEIPTLRGSVNQEAIETINRAKYGVTP